MISIYDSVALCDGWGSHCATGRGRAVRRVPVALCDPARRVINILPELGKYGFVALWRRFWQGKLVKVGEDSAAFLASARYPFEKTFLFEGIQTSDDCYTMKMRLPGERLYRWKVCGDSPPSHLGVPFAEACGAETRRLWSHGGTEEVFSADWQRHFSIRC